MTSVAFMCVRPSSSTRAPSVLRRHRHENENNFKRERACSCGHDCDAGCCVAAAAGESPTFVNSGGGGYGGSPRKGGTGALSMDADGRATRGWGGTISVGAQLAAAVAVAAASDAARKPILVPTLVVVIRPGTKAVRAVRRE